MNINQERLGRFLAEMARIGATPAGGVSRLALSDADRAGRDLFARWCGEAGLSLRVDDLGNMIARREGQHPGLAPVALGSHLDSVARGGRFDGALGVLAALEVVCTLSDHGVQTPRPIEVINWTNEEGARFEPAMLSSGTVAGRFSTEYAYGRTDRDGKAFGEELARIGYRGDRANRPGPLHAYLELHIEQGPVLEEAGYAVGAVTGILGIEWMEVTVEGLAAHAGTTPMPVRRDPMMAAAEIALRARETAVRVNGRATVGRIRSEPGIINVIPSRVVFSIDFRCEDGGRLTQGVESLLDETVAGCQVRFDRFWRFEPIRFALVDRVAAAAARRGVPCMRLVAGAGHDAGYMNDICPTGMIFVRTKNGLSHNEAEEASLADCAAGANLLLDAALDLAVRG